MNLDELQSVQARERQSSDLQHLRSSFYREVGEYIQTLNEKRAQAVEEADDPFSEPEVRRLTDDIETAEGTVEAIYERRVGKVVKKASIAAAGMSVGDDGLTREEESLFEDLVRRIEQNRETVLSVLDGNAPNVSCTIDDEPTKDTEAPTEPIDDDPAAREPTKPDETPNLNERSTAENGIDAANLMGGDSTVDPTTEPADADPEPKQDSEPVSPPSESPPQPTDPESGDDTPTVDVPSDSPAREAVSDPLRQKEKPDKRDMPGLPRTTVRITSDIGEIVGADDRDYDLGAEDVVTLPEPNADVLVEKNAAERL